MAGVYDRSHNNHPNLWDKIMTGPGNKDKQPRQHERMGDYVWTSAENLIPGDGFHDDHTGQSFVIHHIEDVDDHRHLFAEPRKGFVGRTVVSQAQFGAQGITTEDTEQSVFRYHRHQAVPRRQ